MPVRVLRLIARMNVGGPAVEVSGLAKGLDRVRFEQRLLTGYVDEAEADYLELRAPDVELDLRRIEGLGRSIRLGGDARALFEVIREIRRFRPDIVHTHTAKAGVIGRLAARVTRVPFTVHTYHGHLLRGYFSRAGTAAVTAVERGLARGTDRLVAGGAMVRDELLTAGVGRPQQWVVMPPGVRISPPPRREEARARLGLPDEPFVVSLVARLTGVKRPDRFVDVATRVSRTRPNVLFLVAGEGPLFHQTRREAAHLGERIRFLGWRRDVETVYAASDVVVLTSDNEGMPVSLIEAALARRPAVTPDVGSAAEVVLDQSTGLVTSTDPGDIATAVGRLLDSVSLRITLGEAARRHADEHFGPARLVRDTEALYDELVAGRARR